jgi:hypothetical protein
VSSTALEDCIIIQLAGRTECPPRPRSEGGQSAGATGEAEEDTTASSIESAYSSPRFRQPSEVILGEDKIFAPVVWKIFRP